MDGDTCDAIALANHVSAATMFYNNPNILNCSAIAAGTSLCLPLACDTVYTVQDNDTCSTIAADNGLLTADVVSFNTQINWNCTNLHSTNPYWGTTLCVSTPGGTYTAKASNGTTTTSDTTSTVDPPSGAIVANGTTTDCGQWYVDDGSLTCTQVCLSYAIAINLFVEANPSLNKTTYDSDMIVGDAYCIDPLDGWDLTRTSDTSNSTATATATATATTVTATATGTSTAATPSPTEPGATADCTAWHYVVSEDTCYDIAQTAGISLSDFYSWNTAVGDDCSGLWLDYYVCVGV